MSPQRSIPQPVPKSLPPIRSYFDQSVPDHLKYSTDDSNVGSSWPYRLLHLQSWTSYKREPGNKYHGRKEPHYNILSYTWGRWLAHSGTSISIAGLDWPIPAVDPSHFKVEYFQSAIRMAGSGVEFVWVDIACIPQEHAAETVDAVRIRGEEVGKQAKIFAGAQDSFAWLCGLDLKHLFVDGRVPAFRSLKTVLLSAQPTTPSSSAQQIDQFNQILTSTERCIELLLTHPWLSSLWTLQESTLRPNSYILFGTGEIFFEEGPYQLKQPWTINLLRELVGTFADLTLYDDCECKLRQLETMTADPQMPEASRLGYTDAFTARVRKVAIAFLERGLAFKLENNPNVVYSAAQYRTVSKALDVIYGIVQIYGISCTSFPVGDTDEDKLRALEDEFASKLVEQSAVMSQLFIHTTDHKPRRTWLLTKSIHVPQDLTGFRATWQGASASLCTMTVRRETGNLEFRGKGWHLSEFVYNAFSEETQPKVGFTVYKTGQLILDHHVSITLGLDRTQEHRGEEVFPAVQRMLTHYQSGNGAEDLRVLLIGGTRTQDYLRRYVGLVILRRQSGDTQGQRDITSSSLFWERLGLVTWFGIKKMYDLVKGEPRKPLSDWEDLEGIMY